MISSRLISAAFVVALVGCGGGSGGSGTAAVGPPPEPEPPPIAPPTNVTATVDGFKITVSWDASPEADTHHIYYAEELVEDPENYAAYEGASWLADVTSPVTVHRRELRPLFTFVVTAEVDGRESAPSNPAHATTRYRVLGETFVDLAEKLEWRRCSTGQEYDAQTDECIGEPARLNWEGIKAAARALDSDWEIPIVANFMTLRFCTGGSTGKAHFMDFEDVDALPPSQPPSRCDPAETGSTYPGIFPDSAFGSESVYATDSVSRANSQITHSSWVLPWGARGVGGIPIRHPDIAIYSIFVKRLSDSDIAPFLSE